MGTLFTQVKEAFVYSTVYGVLINHSYFCKTQSGSGRSYLPVFAYVMHLAPPRHCSEKQGRSADVITVPDHCLTVYQRCDPRNVLRGIHGYPGIAGAGSFAGCCFRNHYHSLPSDSSSRKSLKTHKPPAEKDHIYTEAYLYKKRKRVH